MPTEYVVWKRNDGVINVSCYIPRGLKTMAGEEISFVHLKTFPEWSVEVVDYVTNARSQQAMLGEVVTS